MVRSSRVVPRKKPTKKSKNRIKSEAEQIAVLYIQTRSRLVRAGRALHDHVGSSLSAAGVRLQLLRMDIPAAKAQIDETLGILEETLGRIRELSDELCPSPAYRGGLKQALLRLVDQNAAGNYQVAVDYSTTATVPAEIAAALHEAGSAVVEQARLHGAKQVSITVRGTGKLVLRITDDGRKSGRVRALSAIRTLARQQGLRFECSAGKGTIVSIHYAIRRSSRG